TGRYSLYGYQMRFDLAKGFHLLTTKRVPLGLIKSEFLWFLKGDTNIRYLLERNYHFWDEWAFERNVKSPDYQGPDMTDYGHRVI
ncbi:thymidylate synthase, partial [Enterococcus faecalis]|uniref:thymidylate synthase n=1 Tax=Enterococcus faecalis TaxID=1351 RepID=UPI003CC6C424